MAFDLILCAIFLTLALLVGSAYLRGVGVGLLIAGATGTVAVLYRRQARSASSE